MREKLIENDIITIFAVGKAVTEHQTSEFDIYSVSAGTFESLMITCIYIIIRCWLKRLAVPEHLSRPSESVIRQAYEVVVWSSNWHMYTDHDFCDYFKQNAKRDIVVENISGLTIAIAPVLNCNL